MDSSTKYVIVACVAALVIIAALAGLYFTVLRKTEATAPEKVVLKCFEAMSSGDINAFVSCFTPEAAPDQTTQDALKRVLGLGTIKYDDVKLKTLNQTATNAEVQVKDFTVNVSQGGQTAQVKMSKIMSGSVIKYQVLNVNGTWLINTKYHLSSSGSMF